MPLWIIFGPEFFRVGGWGSIFLVLVFVPVLLISLVVINIIIRFNWTFKHKHLVTTPQAIVLILLYCSVFLFNLFFVNGGDTEESIASIATRILGRGFENISRQLSYFLLIASIFLVLTAIIVAISGRFTWVQSRKVWLIIGSMLSIIVLMTAVVYVWHTNDPAVKDEQVIYDLRILSEYTQSYVTHYGTLPLGSAEQIAAMDKNDQDLHITDRAGNYTYIPMQKSGQFKLCATFNTDTKNKYPANEDWSTNKLSHHAGYECFTYKYY